MQFLRKFDTSFGLILDDGGRIMLLIFSGIALIIFFVYQWQVATYPYSMDYGEAPLVDQAMRLAGGQNIYRADISMPPYTISNYPPLYIVVLAIGVKLFGSASPFLIGRLISAICAWVAGICLGLIVYKLTRDRFAALSAVAVYLAFPFVVFWSPLLRIDMLALALSLGGLCMLIWEPTSPRHFMIASILLVAAIYTRQSYALAAPFAGFIWLFARDWKQALKLAFVVGGLSLISFLVLNVLTHGGFYFNIVIANVNEFKMDNLKYHWDRMRQVALIPLIFGGVSLFLIRRLNPLWTLAAPYLIGATFSAATIGKIGANINYLLELCAALGLAAGAVVAWSRIHIPATTLRAGIMILLVFGVGRMMHFMVQDQTGNLRDRRAAIHDLSELATLVAKTPGPILADEHMGMLTLEGRPLEIQPFEVTQLAWAGKWDQTPLLDSIDNKEFSAIIIYDVPWAKERWTQEMFDAINSSYTLSDVVAGNKVYMPYERKSAENIKQCPGATWQLPGDSSLGLKWQDGGLNFFGQGVAGKVPVYAVADGLLTRRVDWADAVAIQHDDPLRPGMKLWSHYSDMMAANGIDSYVAEDFPIGAENVPVKAGQLLGYEGSWSGRPQWSSWIHVHFALIQAADSGQFPAQISSGIVVDPSPYLNLLLKSQTEAPNIQSLNCSGG